jgi:hypothetical protein
MRAAPFPVGSTSQRALAAAGLAVAGAAALAFAAPGGGPAPAGAPGAGAAGAAAASAPAAALVVPNAGQAAHGVRFETHGAGGGMLFRDREVVRLGTGMRMRFAGASTAARPAGFDRRPGVVNIVRGAPSAWRTGLPVFAGVVYRGLFPGADLRFSAAAATWRVAAGADPARIGWTYAGADAVRVRADGALELVRRGAGGTRIHTEAPPVAWQRVRGERVGVPARYRVDARGHVGVALGRHDPRLPLGIALGAAAFAAPARAQTPSALLSSTFMGGLQWEEAMDVETDADGSTYFAGFAESVAPVRRAAQARHRGVFDVYVAKFGPDGRTLRYATFLGGADLDVANGLAIDRDGNAYVTGRTGSADFPTRRARQSRLAGRNCQHPGRHDTGEPCHDAFVTKLSAGGSVVYSTYLGGVLNDEAVSIAVDRQGRAFVTGNTGSSDFPTTRTALQRTFRSNDCASTVPCPPDAFVARLSANGRRLTYGSYLGGTKSDSAGGIAVDTDGAAYIVGVTRSADFPTRRARQGRLSGRQCGPPPSIACPDAYVVKLRPSGRALAYGTYLGGTETETAGGIAVDRSGNVYVTGGTQSADFPRARAFQTAIGNSSCTDPGPPKELCADAYITSLSADGQRLRYSTFLGGNAEESGLGIAVDTSGAAYVAGSTDSRAFRVLAPVQPRLGGGIDAYVAEVAPNGQLRSSTYLGGNDAERANGVAVDPRGRVHVAGRTRSPNFPTAAPAQPGLAGDYDVFVTMLR